MRYKEDNTWKRGVVFIKEIVPRRMISLIANNLYGEKYVTHKMKHKWKETASELLVSYEWKVGKEWNHLNCVAEKIPETIIAGSAEEFITEHYWGYTFVSDACTGIYQVIHPKWRAHKVKSYDIVSNTKELYGAEFEETLNQQLRSVFLAEGSDIKVMGGSRIYQS